MTSSENEPTMNHTTETLSISTQLGRRWLNGLRNQHQENRGRSVTRGAAENVFQMISIPHFQNADDQNSPFSIAHQTQSANVGTATLINPTTAPKAYPGRLAAYNDLTETTEEWIDENESTNSPSRQSYQSIVQPCSPIDSLVNIILERFPLAAPTVLLFVGSDDNPHTDSTCFQVALSLAQCNIGNVLLIDSNPKRAITAQCGLMSEKGLSDSIQQNGNWKLQIASQKSSGLDCLPAGSSVMDQWGAVQRLRQMTAEMRQHYQFICVSAGDAHQGNAKLWSGVCDGSYLLVSLTNSNPTIAESAVTELQSSGARLLGCVVTDAA